MTKILKKSSKNFLASEIFFFQQNLLKNHFFLNSKIYSKVNKISHFFPISNIYSKVNAMSQLVWKFRRYAIVMEYERIPALPPPLILFCHIKMIVDVIKKRRLVITNGLSEPRFYPRKGAT